MPVINTCRTSPVWVAYAASEVVYIPPNTKYVLDGIAYVNGLSVRKISVPARQVLQVNYVPKSQIIF